MKKGIYNTQELLNILTYQMNMILEISSKNTYANYRGSVKEIVENMLKQIKEKR